MPFGSFGSTAIEPIAFVGMSAETCFQFGFFARALFVRQTPPPAAPTNSVQSPSFLQLPIVTAVSRPDHCVGLMNDCVPNLSTLSVSGPRDSQYFAMNFGPFFFAFPSALIAPWMLPIVTSDAGIRAVGVLLGRLASLVLLCALVIQCAELRDHDLVRAGRVRPAVHARGSRSGLRARPHALPTAGISPCDATFPTRRK